jgi:hypothetical protein
MKTTKNSNYHLSLGAYELTLDQILVFLVFILCCIYSFFEPSELINSIVGSAQ